MRMSDGELAGLGVLVTRPKHQAAEFSDAIQAAGGNAIGFPAIEIVPRSAADIDDDATALQQPDIVIFISANAARFGLAYIAAAKVAAVGPATAAALEAAGQRVDIRPAAGFDSEHLLEEPELQSVDGKVVRIIRGSKGRELIADTLRQRGAIVEYLPVYTRRAPDVDASSAAALEQAWRSGNIDVVTVMSVETLTNLVSMLPEWCSNQLGKTPLVTPASRVIIEATKLFPGVPATLAQGPAAKDMIRAIAEHVPGQS
jgi:uroporphyrinogen-III synthase